MKLKNRPIDDANAFTILQDYYQASEHDPEELVRDQLGNPRLQRKRLDGTWVPYTWGEELEDLKNGVAVTLCNPRNWLPQYHKPWSVEFALSVEEELIHEIPNMADIEYD